MPIQNTPSIPHNDEAEEAALGALLIDTEAISDVSWLKPEDFYQSRHAIIFEAMLNLAQRGERRDFVILHDELERTGKLSEIGGASYLGSLINAAPTAIHLTSYARRVQHAAVCRRLIRVAGKLAQLGYEQPTDIDDMLAQAEHAIFDLRKGRHSAKIITPAERARAAADRYERRQEGGAAGIPYGLLALDQWTQGAEPGQLIIVAGRPGMGKSSLLQNLAENMSRQGVPILFATCEMPDAQLVDRSVSGRVRMSLHTLQRGQWGEDIWADISKALGDISEEPFYSYDDADMTTAGLRAAAIEAIMRYGIKAIYADYLQLFSDPSKGNEVERLTGVSRGLKGIARALGVPLIAAAQLSRAVEGREDNRPRLSDLRGSGSIEQDADIVVFIRRLTGSDTTAEISIAKQRNGPSNIASNVRWNGALTRFEDLEERYQYTG